MKGLCTQNWVGSLPCNAKPTAKPAAPKMATYAVVFTPTISITAINRASFLLREDNKPKFCGH